LVLLLFFGLIPVPVIFFGLIPVPVIFFGLVTTPLKTPIWSCYDPPYLFLVLLQSSVFGLITTPLFLVLLRDPLKWPSWTKSHQFSIYEKRRKRRDSFWFSEIFIGSTIDELPKTNKISPVFNIKHNMLFLWL
jgi:hypothetical protein